MESIILFVQEYNQSCVMRIDRQARHGYESQSMISVCHSVHGLLLLDRLVKEIRSRGGDQVDD